MTRSSPVAFVGACLLALACPSGQLDPDACDRACDLAVACGILPSILGNSQDDDPGALHEACVDRCTATDEDAPQSPALLACLTAAASPGVCDVDICTDAILCLRGVVPTGAVGEPEVTFKLIDGEVWTALFQPRLCADLPPDATSLPDDELRSLCAGDEDPCPPGDAPGERLVKVTGRSGGYVDQITFYTSTGRMLGPYGGSGGQPFELEPDYGDHILGFHGRAAGVIDALGVCSGIYGSPMHGGLGGDPFLDDLTRAKRIRRITIRHQGYIDAIQVHWIDGEDRPQEGVRHGGGGGKEAYFELEADEAIVKIRGRAGGFVDRLEFLTNRRRRGACPCQGGEPFEIDIGPDRRLVGFWGRAGGYVDAIGVCLTPANQLAAGKPASASSVYDDNYLPGRASDGGSAATGGWSPVYQPVGSWWQVDLGEARRLRRVEFVTRQDLDQPETRRNFQVWASNHRDMSEGHVVLAAHGDQPTPFRHVFSFPVNDPTPYRYVALVKVAPEYFFIAKVRVYGD